MRPSWRSTTNKIEAQLQQKLPRLANTYQPYIELNCSLGEGPFWEEETNTVRFLDVEKQELHRVDINKGPSSHKLVKKLDISIG